MPSSILKVNSIVPLSSSILKEGLISENAKPKSASVLFIFAIPFSSFLTLYHSPSLTGIRFLKLIFGKSDNNVSISIEETLYLLPSLITNKTENPFLSGSKSPCFFKTLKFI